MLRAAARGSLVRRLILLAAGWSLAVLVVTGMALTAFFRQSSVEQFQDSVAEIADGLYAGAGVAEDGGVTPPPYTDMLAQRVYSGRYWQIAEPVDEGVRPVVRSRSLFDEALAGPPDGLRALSENLGQPVFYDTVGPRGEPVRAAAIMAYLQGREAPLIFMAAEDRRPIDRQAGRFAALTASALVALGIGLVLAVFLQVRFGLAPLFNLGREIADVRKGKAQRFSGAYPQEIAPLAQELNALLDHNQEVVERQRTHVGNLAHALKTPLSVMLTEANSASGELAETVRRQTEVMKSQVDHHLRRARAAARAQSAGERTRVEDVLDELASMLERVYQSKDVVIDWRAPEDLCFRGERQDLLEIVGNVVENACKWCRRRVRVTAGPGEPGTMVLVVEDDGPGLPEESRAAVLKRGERLDEDAPGSGLGLSIVDELTRAYGGRLTLEESALGGLKAALVLPAAEA